MAGRGRLCRARVVLLACAYRSQRDVFQSYDATSAQRVPIAYTPPPPSRSCRQQLTFAAKGTKVLAPGQEDILRAAVIGNATYFADIHRQAYSMVQGKDLAATYTKVRDAGQGAARCGVYETTAWRRGAPTGARSTDTPREEIERVAGSLSAM